VTRSRFATGSVFVSSRSTRPRSSFGAECYGRAASRTTKKLLPVGSRVRLFREPATDGVDQYGLLLRYIVGINGAVNVNIRPRRYRGGRALLLPRAKGSLRSATRGSCKECEGEEAWPLGSLPAHTLNDERPFVWGAVGHLRQWRTEKNVEARCDGA